MSARVKFLAPILLALAPVGIAELAARWWMSGGPPQAGPVLELRLPTGEWQQNVQGFEEVRPSLRCSSGWMVDQASGPGTWMGLSFFRWDATDTGNTLEAFTHLPEQCMGGVGMRLEKIHPRRVLSTPQGELVFDSTQFRNGPGGRVLHVFKCVWVHGHEGSDLRGGVLRGKTGRDLRQLRLAAALERFRPRHTRVVMGGVGGMPTEALAWAHFRPIVENHLSWSPDLP